MCRLFKIYLKKFSEHSRRDAANLGFSFAFLCYQPYAAMRRKISLQTAYFSFVVTNLIPLCGERFPCKLPTFLSLLPTLCRYAAKVFPANCLLFFRCYQPYAAMRRDILLESL